MVIFISGLTGKRLLVSVFLLLLAGMVFGIDKEDIKVYPPIFKSNNSEIDISDLDKAAEDAFNDIRDNVYNFLEFLPDDFTNLAGGFANASVFSSDGASQRGYEGYKAFSFTFGFMGGFKLPRNFSVFSILNLFKNSGNVGGGQGFFEDNMDDDVGIDPQILNAQFGINTSFLLKGLYLGFKFSKFDTHWISGVIPLSGFSFSTLSIGVNASYQLISQKRLLAGLLVWRGLNLGTGFIWQNTSFNLSPALSIDDNPIPIEGFETINMPVDAVFHLGFETNTYIVPIKAMTSIRLLGFLNLAAGVGVDIAFGSSKIGVSGSFKVDKDKVNRDLQDKGLTMETDPSLVLSPVGGESKPSILNIKVMGAVGFNFGPAIIDIPLTYYFLNNGYSVGVTFGVAL